jgi:endonuclease G
MSRLFLFLPLFLFSALAAAGNDCPALFLNGVAPEITNTAMASHARELCFDEYAVMHSGITRTPLWSAEHLTRNGLRKAKVLERVNSFHEEDRLPAGERAYLSDYARSGYDRGHNSPSADFDTEKAQHESFSLANMMPQDPNNNRNLWEGIESAVRTLAKNHGELYVITGPLFLGQNIKRLHGRVMVPTHLYKVVYDPSRRKGAAYFVENEATNDYKVISISELEQKSGINFFPGMSASDKKEKLDLPVPTPHGSHGEMSRGNGDQRYYPHTPSAGSVFRALFR